MADEIRLDEEGNLLINTPFGTVTHRKPEAYQDKSGLRTAVECLYTIDNSADGKWTVGFEITEAYDSSLPLVMIRLLCIPPV